MSEGIPAFQENDPVKFLTSTEWDPYYNDPFSESVTLKTVIQPSDFSLDTEFNPFYIPPDEFRNTSITIKNNCETESYYNIDIQTELEYRLEKNNVKINPQKSKIINLSISSPEGKNELVKIFVESINKSKSKNLTITCIKSYVGIEIYPKQEKHLLKLENEHININYQLTNLANNTESYIFESRAINKFRPIIKNVETKNFNEKANGDQIIKTWEIELAPLETKKIIFRPNFAYNKEEGTYNIKIDVTSKENPKIYTRANITIVYSENLVVTIKEPEKKISTTENATYQIKIDEGELTRKNIFIKNNLIKGNAKIKTFYNNRLISIGEEKTSLTIDKKNGSIINVTISPLENNGEEIITEFTVNIPGDKPDIGALPFIIMTIITTIIAVLIAAPLGIGVAILLAEFTPRRIRKFLRPIYELLAGIPSVIYGLWGFWSFGPLLSKHVYPIIANTIGKIIILSTTDAVKTPLPMFDEYEKKGMILPIVFAIMG
jgi:ABC-type sugar transport system permease subunit